MFRNRGNLPLVIGAVETAPAQFHRALANVAQDHPLPNPSPPAGEGADLALWRHSFRHRAQQRKQSSADTKWHGGKYCAFLRDFVTS